MDAVAARGFARAVCAMALSLMPVAAAADFTLDGDFRQGGLIRGSVTPADAEITLDGEPVATSGGQFIIGFGRDHGPVSVLRAAGSASFERTLAIEPQTYQTQEITGLPQRLVSPGPADAERIQADQAAVLAARGQWSLRTGAWETFRWPVIGIITGVYGSARILNGEARNPHYGIDIAAAEGTPVVAPASGRVVLAHPDMFYTGATVVLDHGHGVSSTFLHLSRIDVAVGTELAAGQPFAAVGSTGRSTGPHLDWRMNWNRVRLDPALLAPPMPAPAP